MKKGVKGSKRTVAFKPLAPKQDTRNPIERDKSGFIHLTGYLPSDESFSTQDEDGWQYHWNVAEARRWAELNTRLLRFRPADYGITTQLVREQYPDMDAAYAMTTDLNRPLLLALFRKHEASEDMADGLQLLDGWHRLYKALLTGTDSLPAYLLSREQADTFQFAKLPPGKGIKWGKPNRK